MHIPLYFQQQNQQRPNLESMSKSQFQMKSEPSFEGLSILIQLHDLVLHSSYNCELLCLLRGWLGIKCERGLQKLNRFEKSRKDAKRAIFIMKAGTTYMWQ